MLSPNAALDYQTFHAEPQSLFSRRDDTCERLRSLRGLRPYEERAERPSVYVETWLDYLAPLSHNGRSPCVTERALLVFVRKEYG